MYRDPVLGQTDLSQNGIFRRLAAPREEHMHTKSIDTKQYTYEKLRGVWANDEPKVMIRLCYNEVQIRTPGPGAKNPRRIRLAGVCIVPFINTCSGGFRMGSETRSAQNPAQGSNKVKGIKTREGPGRSPRHEIPIILVRPYILVYLQRGYLHSPRNPLQAPKHGRDSRPASWAS